MEEANIKLARAALALNCGHANLQFVYLHFQNYQDSTVRRLFPASKEFRF